MAEPRVVGVIQARMGSTRLPGKVLMPLAGAPLLQRLIERVRGARRLAHLVVATSEQPENDAIAELCARIGCPCHRGSESDVLRRMLDACGADADIMVRLTADNPFVDGELVDMVVAALLAEWPRAAYAANVDDCGFPYGLFVEAAATAPLRRALASSDPMDHEHVTWHVRQRPETYPRVNVRAPLPFGCSSLTIDTPEDYQRLRPFFERLHAGAPSFTYRDIAAACGPEVQTTR